MSPSDATVAHAESHRDRGLIRGVGVVALAFTIINGVVGSGIFRLPAAMAASVGGLAPLAYLACGVAMGAVVLCCAEAGSRVPTSGGLYGYIEAGLGPLPAFIGGFLGVYLSAALACGGVAVAVAQVAASAMPALGGPAGRTAVILVILGGFTLTNLRGVAFASRFISVVTVAKLVPLVLFVAVGIWFVDAAHFTAPAPAGADGFGRAMIFALFAFSGMETPLAASGEVANPSRTVPRALIVAMLVVLGFYIALQMVAQGLLGPGLATSPVPLADAIGTVSPMLRAVLLAGAGVSMLFWIAGDLFGAPRALFAFARDGLLPAALGRLSARGRVPHVAILVHAAIAFALAVTGTFEQLAILAALATTVLYSLACIAAWRLHVRDVAIMGPPVRFRLLPVAALVGVGAMLAILIQAERAELIGTAAAVIGTIVIYRIARRGLPQG